MLAVVVIGVFFVADKAHLAFRSPNVAAVISGVLVDLANSDRQQDQLANLTVNPVLVAAAQAKADDMATKGYFAHTSPGGLDPWYWFKQAGYNFDYAGENLAVDFSDSGDVNTAWMNSPLHRDNILNPHYTEIGIATAEGTFEGHHTIFVVQEFGAPSQKKIQAPVTAEVPQNPETLASAAVQPSASVETPAPRTPVVAGASTHEAAVPVEKVQQASLKDSIIASPKTALHYAYYILTLLILFTLWYVTRLEMKRHHLKHFGAATALIIAIAVLIFVTDYVVFTPPVIAATGTSNI